MPDQVPQKDSLVMPHERLDDLQFCGLKIIQDPSAFCFGMDAVLLSDFAQVRPKDKVADLGTGTGIISLLLAGREKSCTIDGIEIQPQMAAMAERSVRLNGLGDRVHIHCQDMTDAWKTLGCFGKTLVVSNPPYWRHGTSLVNPEQSKGISRHEEICSIQDVCVSASSLLRNGGRFCVVFPTARMLELMDAMRKVKLEPKRFRLVYPKASKAPNLVLLEAVKDAKPMLHPMPPLVVYEEDGTSTRELRRIYHQDLT